MSIFSRRGGATTEVNHEQLSKWLQRLSLIAAGQDAEVDALLDSLRAALKQAKWREVEVLMMQLGEATLKLEQRTDQEGAQRRELLRELACDWLSLTSDKALHQAVSGFIVHLPKTIAPAATPEFLGALRALQRRLVNHLAQQAAAAQIPANAQSFVSEEWEHLLADFVRTLSPFRAPFVRAPSPMIADTLLKPQSPAQLAQALRELQELTQQVLAQSAQSFTHYLDSVSQELVDLNQLLEVSLGAAHQHARARTDLHLSLDEQIHNFETVARSSGDLDTLKGTVQRQIDHLRLALAQIQGIDQLQASSDAQLPQLVNKIKELEADAQRNREQLAEQQHRATHDPLTRLPNRYAYQLRLDSELARFTRYQRAAVLAVFDIDNFKKINDQYGHAAGDRVISVIGNTIVKRLRQSDFFGRYGGEEFVAILPEIDATRAQLLLDDVRQTLADSAFNYKQQPLQLTVSIGFTEFAFDDTQQTLFERADRALYQAKRDGRNCTRLG